MPQSLKWPVAILVALLACTGVAIAAIPDADGYTYVCVNKVNGAISAREKGAACKNNETASRVVSTQNAIPRTTTYRAQRNITVPGNGTASGSVPCNDGDVATGGGHAALGGGSGYAIQSNPNGPTPDTWFVFFANTGANDIQVALFAVCQHTE